MTSRATAAVDDVVARAGLHALHVGAADHAVVARARLDLVGPVAGDDDVTAVGPEDRLGRVGPHDQRVVAVRRAGLRQRRGAGREARHRRRRTGRAARGLSPSDDAVEQHVDVRVEAGDDQVRPAVAIRVTGRHGPCRHVDRRDVGGEASVPVAEMDPQAPVGQGGDVEIAVTVEVGERRPVRGPRDRRHGAGAHHA